MLQDLLRNVSGTNKARVSRLPLVGNESPSAYCWLPRFTPCPTPPQFPLIPPLPEISLFSRGNPFHASTRSTLPPHLCDIRASGFILLPSPVPAFAS